MVEFKAGQDIESIQQEYYGKFYALTLEYLRSSRPVTAFRNAIYAAVNDGMTLAFIAGYADAGGAAEELADDARDWIISRIEQEVGFVNGLFENLKALRSRDGVIDSDLVAASQSAADGYTATLTGVYAAGKTYGAANIMGTWHLGATSEHCETCSRLDGQRHRLKWFRDHGYLPQEPGTSALKCGGYKCKCHVDDDEGNQLLP